MTTITRSVVAVAASLALIFSASASDAAFEKNELKCRGTIIKNATKISKAALKAVTACHDANAKAGSELVDCTDLALADAAKGKVAKAVSKLTGSVGIGGKKDKCDGLSPAAVLYGGSCPSIGDCAAAISTMADVAACIACIVQADAENMSTVLQGNPTYPLGGDEAGCQKTIGKAYSKQSATILKERTKCQTKAEKSGTMTTASCLSADIAKITDAELATRGAIGNSSNCGTVDFDGGNLEACTDDGFSAPNVGTCTGRETDTRSEDLAGAVLEFSTFATTTTTSTSTTTSTTLPGAEECPDRGQLTIWAGVGSTSCSSNTDCTNADPDSPQTCDTILGKCVTGTRLDAGWTGHGHDGDVNDKVLVGARLNCPGGDLPSACGECSVVGIDPLIDSARNCRCAGNPTIINTVCDEPFQNDADDCGGNLCQCYFGAPFPAVASGVPVCVVNRFAEDIGGTVNVDTGSGIVNSFLRSQTHLGASPLSPCPYCGGTCTNNGNDCANDLDCGTCDNDTGISCTSAAQCSGVGGGCSFPGTCDNDDTAGDGVRDGICIGATANVGNPCDVMAFNTSFPARIDAEGGAGYSLDCLPNNNVSGEGLAINLNQTTGTATLAANLPCGGTNPVFTGQKCQCRTCNLGPTRSCTANADCEPAGRFCSDSESSIPCTDNVDCGSIPLGVCSGPPVFVCTGNNSVSCAANGNADCFGDAGTCELATCTTDGSGAAQPTAPSGCNVNGICNDVGDDRGQCDTGPVDSFCDGVVKANGDGVEPCPPTDCAGTGHGACTLTKPRPCFLPTLNATGAPDPEKPLGAAVFCAPPTNNSGINSAVGLPGPARSYNQATGKTFCPAPNETLQYTPGSPNCPTSR